MRINEEMLKNAGESSNRTSQIAVHAQQNTIVKTDQELTSNSEA
jgi:hypothetical protein